MRYADDMIILVLSRQAGERVKASITRFITGKLKLKVNEDKRHVARPWDVKFLGFRICKMYGKTRIVIHDKAIEGFKDKVRQIVRRSRAQA